MSRIAVINHEPHPAQRRRMREIARKGYRYVGGQGTDLFAEACFLAGHAYLAGLHVGVVLDRGADKSHGTGKRYEAPYGYDGEPVYWLRKTYQVTDE